MLRWLWFYFCPVFVLMSGLLSCGSEKKSRDVFTPNIPVLGGHSLRDWDHSDDRTVDLDDLLDFDDADLTSVRVYSQCRLDGHYSEQHVARSGATTLRIFELLPEPILLTSLPGHKLECEFEFTLANSVGSNHIYHISPAPIVDRGRETIHLRSEGSDREAVVTSVSLRNLDSLVLRSTSLTPEFQLQVRCSEFTTPPRSYGAYLRLSELGFSEIEFTGRSPQGQEVAAKQLCRALALLPGQPPQISGLFSLKLFTQPAEMRDDFSPYIRHEASSAASLDFQNFTRQMPLRIRQVTFTSRSRVLHWLRYPSRLWNLNMGLTVELMSLHPSLTKTMLFLDRPWITTRAHDQIHAGDFNRVQLPPGQSVPLEMIAQTGSAGPLFGIDTVQGGEIEVPSDFPIEEIDEDGEVIARFAIHFDHHLYFSRSFVNLDNLNPHSPLFRNTGNLRWD